MDALMYQAAPGIIVDPGPTRTLGFSRWRWVLQRFSDPCVYKLRTGFKGVGDVTAMAGPLGTNIYEGLLTKDH